MGKDPNKKILVYLANIKDGTSEAVELPSSVNYLEDGGNAFKVGQRPLGSRNFLRELRVEPSLPDVNYISEERSRQQELAKLTLSQKIDAAGGRHSKRIVVSSDGKVKESVSIGTTPIYNLGPRYQNLLFGTHRDVPFPLDKPCGMTLFSDSSHLYEHLATYHDKIR